MALGTSFDRGQMVSMRNALIPRHRSQDFPAKIQSKHSRLQKRLQSSSLLRILDAGQKESGLWGRDCKASYCNNSMLRKIFESTTQKCKTTKRLLQLRCSDLIVVFCKSVSLLNHLTIYIHSKKFQVFLTRTLAGSLGDFCIFYSCQASLCG